MQPHFRPTLEELEWCRQLLLQKLDEVQEDVHIGETDRLTINHGLQQLDIIIAEVRAGIVMSSNLPWALGHKWCALNNLRRC